ncbi:MAG: rane protein [Microbacteriaceae bacterium]|nr:rane protein [Microbacteriaceae bacterium]
MTIYRERLWASLWMFLATALVIPASLLVFLPINMTAGVIVAIVLYGGCVALLAWGSPVVEVTTESFMAGRARLPLAYVGLVSGYREEDATMERGQRLDARAWLLIRGWISPVIKVELLDPADPTPYWIVSTRHPEAIIAAVATARQSPRQSV